MVLPKVDFFSQPAISVQLNLPQPFYAFTLPATDVRKITYVSERTKDNPEEGIERTLNLTRCKKIGEYIKTSEATFPNSIIIAFPKTTKYKSNGKTGAGTIIIPNKPGQGLILDGQHRLYGFDYANGKNMELLIVAFIDIAIETKAHIFRMINGEQKPVNKSLVYDLLDLDTSTATFEEERSHEIVKLLDRDNKSPFFNSVQMTGMRKEGFISQASLIGYLKLLFKKGGLFRDDNYSTFNAQTTLLIDYFSAIQDTFPSDWGNPQSILSKTTGINALFRLLGDFVKSIEENDLQPTHDTFLLEIEQISDLDLSVKSYKLYGGGGAIQLTNLLREQLNFHHST